MLTQRLGFRGGVIEFDELNPGDYTIEAKAFDSNEGDLVVGWGISSATVNAGESAEKTEPSYIVGGNIKWCSSYRKQYRSSLKN